MEPCVINHLDLSQFFQINDNSLSGNIQVSTDIHSFSKSLTYDPDLWIKLLQGNYSCLTFPLLYKQKYGKRFNDILGTGYTTLFLISLRMKELMEKNNLTGWKTFPIILHDKKKNIIEGYFGFSITGKCGPIDYNKSCISEGVYPSMPKVKYYNKLFIDLNTWDGSDFFMPEGYYSIIATKKAADVLANSDLTNLRITNFLDVISTIMEK